MGAFVFCIFYLVNALFVSLVVGSNFGSPAGVVGIFIVTSTLLASADLGWYLVRGPLHAVFRLGPRGELGGVLALVFWLSLMTAITGSVMFFWGSIAHGAFGVDPFPAREAYRLAGSATVINGILVSMGMPNRFGALAGLAERYNARR